MFTCKYDVETNIDQTNIEVTWYQGNSTHVIHKENVQWWKRQGTLQNKKNAKPVFQLGTTVGLKFIIVRMEMTEKKQGTSIHKKRHFIWTLSILYH